MKKLFLTIIALFAIATAQAQEENAAFYIYQNDGHFDGFFYDQVEKISYSKLDTLGVEHDDYVSQEIVTADSTYRIMLTAIDSIGFVQPEIRYNPRLRDMRKEGMTDYLTNRDEEALMLTFSPSMPASLIPHEGDVLADFEYNSLFGGRVKSVSTSGGSITVVCDALESVHDIFEQFVTVEQYGQDNAGNMVRRRVAGMPQLTKGEFPTKSRRNSSGEYAFNFFNFSMSGHFPVYTSPGGDVNISVDADVSVVTDVKALWNFPLWGKDQMSILITMNNDVGLGFTLDGKIKDIFPFGLDAFGGMPLPAAAPIFIIEFGFDGFLRGEYHAKINLQTPKYKGKAWGKLYVDGDWKHPHFNCGFGTPPGEQEPDPVAEAENNKWNYSIEFNGFEQCGAKTGFSFGLSKLLSKIVGSEVTFTTYLGPKISGALNFSLSNVMQDQMSAYNLLKDSKLSFSPLTADYEVKATVSSLFTEKREWTLADGGYNFFGDVDLFLFPDCEVEATAEGKALNYKKVTATVTPSRNIIWPVNVGFGVFENDELVDYTNTLRDSEGKKMPAYWQFSKEWKEASSATGTLSVRPGKFVLRPIFTLGGTEIYGSGKNFEVPGPYINIGKRDTLRFGSGGGIKSFMIDTNCQDLGARIDYSALPSHWQIQFEDSNCIVTTEKLHGLYNLSGTLYVTGKFKDKETGEESETESRNFKTLVQEADGQYNRFVLTAYERAEKFPCSVSGSYPAVSIHAHKDANTGTFEETYDSYDMSLEMSQKKNEEYDFMDDLINGTISRVRVLYDRIEEITIRLEDCEIRPYKAHSPWVGDGVCGKVSLTRKTTRFTLTNGKYKLGETTTDHSEINDYQNIILLGYEE
ncbi:MAG: hypothetical protein IJ559_03920 [Prevotella sp.]|nr:hypothetical protein [Prevotella sp.]